MGVQQPRCGARKPAENRLQRNVRPHPVSGTIHANPQESWGLANPIGDYLGTNAVTILIPPQLA